MRKGGRGWGVGVAVAVLQGMPAPLSSSVHIRDIGRGFFLAWEDYAGRFDESFPACAVFIYLSLFIMMIMMTVISVMSVD